MFNKRHYQAIAQVIQDLCLSNDEHDDEGLAELETLRMAIASQFADMFKSDNPMFYPERFIYACKPGSNVRAKTAHLKANWRRNEINIVD